MKLQGKKGLWVNGKPPYGYKKGEHHLLYPEQPFANNVKTIFEEYLKVKNVIKLQEILKEKRILSRTNKPIPKASLYRILSSKVYLGKIAYKDKIYDAQHEQLVSEELFNSVQNLLKLNATEREHRTNAKCGTLLSGLLYDDKGNLMSPTYSKSGNKLYRYYISQAIKDPSKYERGQITKISAGEIEQYINNDARNLLDDTLYMQTYLDEYSVEQQKLILKEMNEFSPDKVFIRTIIKRIDLQLNFIKINYDINYIIKYFATRALNAKFTYTPNDEVIITRVQNIIISVTPQKQNKIIIPGKANYDMKLIQAIVKSFWYNKLGAERRLPPEARNGNNKRLRKLRFLPPEIIESIMNGTQDPELNVKKLIAMADESTVLKNT